MSGKRPWMPLYIDDFLSGTAHLTTTEVGAYILLIMSYWSKGGLPKDEVHIQKISRLSKSDWKKARDTLANFFTDGWRHERIDAELAKAIEKSKVNSANAAKSHVNRKRSAGRSHPVSQPTLHTPDSMDYCGVVSAPARDPTPELPPELAMPPEPPPSIGSKIDPGWCPSPTDRAVAIGLDMDDETVEAQARAFVRDRMEREVFSNDWSASWSAWCRHWAKTAKPKKGKPRVSVDRKPAAPAPRRVLITDEAFAVAAKVLERMGVNPNEPIAVGAPSIVQSWLSEGFSPDLIIEAVSVSMAKRNGEPPSTLRYFDKPIARAVAEFKRPISITPATERNHGSQRTESLSEVARRQRAGGIDFGPRPAGIRIGEG